MSSYKDKSNYTEINSSVNIDDEIIESKLFLQNIYNNQFYLLKFKTIDVIIQPIFLKPRIFLENDTDKSVQPRSESIFKLKCNLKTSRVNILHRTFRINKNNDRLSYLSTKIPVLKSKLREKSPPKIKPSISDKSSSIEKSIIYIKKFNINWILYPGIVKLNQIKPIDYENQREQQQMLFDLGMETTEELKNKANFIIKHKKDVFKISFKLINIEFKSITERISQGIQVKDENEYFKAFSQVTYREVFISVPKSTYEYIDPMIKIKVKNNLLKLHKLESRWTHITRMKRLQEYRKCRIFNPYEDIQELRIGSSICFEGNDCINKAIAGVIHCGIDNSEYENWVIGYQKINYDSTEIE